MTGEITLHGNVLPIGGLPEKAMAAYKAGMKTVIIPARNVPDLDDIDEVIKENVQFVTAERLETVLQTALVEPVSPSTAFLSNNSENIAPASKTLMPV
jgi:ATP-dependent Lon protease